MLMCYYAYSLMYLKRLFCFTNETLLDLQHVRTYLVTVDRELRLVTDITGLIYTILLYRASRGLF